MFYISISQKISQLTSTFIFQRIGQVKSTFIPQRLVWLQLEVDVRLIIRRTIHN